MGVDLYARAKSDSQKIHNGELATGGFTAEITITSPDNLRAQTIGCAYTDISLTINPDTGLPMVGSKIGVSVSLEDFTIWDKKESLKRWKASLVNNSGLTCAGEIEFPMADHTFSDLTFILKLNTGGRT